MDNRPRKLQVIPKQIVEVKLLKGEDFVCLKSRLSYLSSCEKINIKKNMNKKEITKKDLKKMFKENLSKPSYLKEKARLLKKRKSVVCDCKKIKSQLRDRGKYGTCYCDGYSLYNSLGTILSNALYQYIADAKCAIIRDDFDLIEKHANAIRDYAEADSWDKTTISDDGEKSAITIMMEYNAKEEKWREAMFWLTESWHGLWW